ncbi:serpin family protein [Methanoculleus sp. YWC-01]|uniref:Serpin family protein n=1 Tax=Methanoculleus nereidis TaxID=2735141 RepID=A0ABU3Z5B2_9EURY|nr:serpin family protein [Methanoculleus sp. YWC-01]MDV4344013.1 serpin family protein [Methanoculleus sp. YWC-01]
MKGLIFSGIGILVLALILAGLAVCGTAPLNTTSVSGESVADDSVAAGNNRFAFDLYRRLAAEPAHAGDNLFFSPYSISSALAITCEGARGTTADEIRSVLHLPTNETLRREGFADLNAALNSGSANYTLRTANALWAEETYSFLPEYIGAAARWYGANVTNLDFISDPGGSRETINRWVEGETEEKIRDLLPPGSIDPLTRLVITNAIYFKGTWVEQFDANETTKEEFRVGPDETATVAMMHGNAVYPYAETEALQVLEMPYAHGNETELAMLVLLPKDDTLTAAEEALDAERLAGLRESLVSQNVRVFFPKFTLDAEYSLPPALAAMGMPTAFTDDADLSGMDGTKDLFVTGVFHKAFIDVNEEGTEAAAATGVVVGGGVAPIFRADHPFVFLITEKDSGTILFMGRVVNPEGT